MPAVCAECGAVFHDPGRSCRERFAALLALDHSHQEPWGSRHGLVFAAFQLQHAAALEPATVDRCWLALYSIYVLNHESAKVFAALRTQPNTITQDWDVPAPTRPYPVIPYAVTIADMGDCEPENYPAAVDRWCRAVLAAWGLTGPAIALKSVDRES